MTIRAGASASADGGGGALLTLACRVVVVVLRPAAATAPVAPAVAATDMSSAGRAPRHQPLARCIWPPNGPLHELGRGVIPTPERELNT